MKRRRLVRECRRPLSRHGRERGWELGLDAMRRLTIGGIWRTGGVLLVALALAVRLATPSGWMLAAGDGGPKLVICTGHAPSMAPKAPGRHQDNGRDQHACVFAGAHAASAPPTPDTLRAEAPVVILDRATPS